MTRATNTLPLGSLLEEYQIDSVLGAGGFGITYKARDISLETWVAIKEYFPVEWAYREPDGKSVLPSNVYSQEKESKTHGSDYEWGLDCFLNEARVLASIDHPYVVRVRRYFRANGTAYIVMNYEDGQPLSVLLPKGEMLTEQEIRGLLQDVLPALQAVHDKGILHRDLKPSNLYVRSHDHCVILIDFGAAREAIESYGRSITSLVSPGYSPPEQYSTRSDRYGNWTDIYALGAILYRCITGYPPIEAAERLLDDRLEPAMQAGAGRYSENLLAVVDRALAVRPEDRYQNVAEIQADLATIPGEILSHRHLVKPGNDTDWRSLRRAPAVIGVLMLVGAVAFWWWTLASDNAPAGHGVGDIGTGDPGVKATASAPESDLDSQVTPMHSESIHLARPKVILEEGKVVVMPAPSAEEPIVPEGETVISTELTTPASEKPMTLEENEKIKQFLALASQHFTEYRLAVPKDDSALYYYQQVLRIDPDNLQAKQGMSEIATRYAQLAERSLNQSQFTKASDLIQLGLSVDPQHPQLLNLEEQVTQRVQTTQKKTSRRPAKKSFPNRLRDDIRGLLNRRSSGGSRSSQGFQSK